MEIVGDNLRETSKLSAEVMTSQSGHVAGLVSSLTPGEESGFRAELVGTTLDNRYHVKELLGVGGMSAVYKAYDVALNKVVALKMLHPHLTSQRNSLERFLQEGRTESSLQHPNVVSVLTAGVDNTGRFFLVMEYLEGKSLETIIDSDKPLSISAAREIFLQICDALAYTHSQGVIHRDLKPGNIMLVGKDYTVVKIADFGIAKLLSMENSGLVNTVSGAIVGSPAYMSPEQCQGTPVDARSDIYSMGCLMYQVLTGWLPFEADNSFAMICRHLNDAPQSFLAIAPERKIPPALERIVLQAMEKSPERRFRDASQLFNALKSFDANDEFSDFAEPGGAISKQKKFGTAKSYKSAIVIAALFLVAYAVIFNSPCISFWLHLPGLQQKLSEAEAQYGSESAEYAKTAIPIADGYWAADAKAQARSLYRKILTADSQRPMYFQFGAKKEIEIAGRAATSALEYQQILTALGDSHLQLKNYMAARGLLEAVTVMHGASPALINSALQRLIIIASAQQDYSSAERYTGQALSLLNKSKTLTTSAEVISLLDKRAECSEHSGHFSAAINDYRMAMSMVSSDTSASAMQAAMFLKKIGNCLRSMHDDNDAIANYRKSLDALERVIPPPLQDVAELRRSIGDCFYQNAKYALAAKAYKECLALKNHLPVEEASQAEVLLANCMFAQKKTGECCDFVERLIAERTAKNVEPDQFQELIALQERCKAAIANVIEH